MFDAVCQYSLLLSAVFKFSFADRDVSITSSNRNVENKLGKVTCVGAENSLSSLIS